MHPRKARLASSVSSAIKAECVVASNLDLSTVSYLLVLVDSRCHQLRYRECMWRKNEHTCWFVCGEAAPSHSIIFLVGLGCPSLSFACLFVSLSFPLRVVVSYAVLPCAFHLRVKPLGFETLSTSHNFFAEYMKTYRVYKDMNVGQSSSTLFGADLA